MQDINYYYENMIKYRESLKYVMKEYYELLKNVSDIIKNIGGSGRIHGNIVDIDFYNHIYINPVTGEIKFYYATSISKRYEFSSIENLLENKRKDLYLQYKKMI